MGWRTMRTGAVAVASSVLLSGAACASSTSAASSSPAASGVNVVASTNVWGDIAEAIGGNRVQVTSIISDPSADPHSYEASARTRLAVSKADVVIENGGGYDDFMSRLVSSAQPKAVINAVDVSGRAAAARAAGQDLNEHIWYDFPSVAKVADRIASTLSSAAPGDAGTFRANATRFQGQLHDLITREATDRLATEGAGVAITEPVPLYLLNALGAVNKTPRAFSKAVEDGTDVPPAVLQHTLDLFGGGAVKALVYNAQTTDAQTEQLKKAARDHHVAVVPVTETLPPGNSYLAWMTANLAAISKALRA
jgi:zinc/manganese transport system substrate-binding protein